MKSTAKRVLAGVLTLLVWAVVTPGTLADEQIVYFKNGRAMRVLDIRDEGDWVYLVISKPKEPEKMTNAQKREEGVELPEDLARELGVRASTIDRIESARTGAATSRNAPATRTANGVVSNPGAFDGTSGSRGYVVKELSPEEIARRQALAPPPVENTRSTADGPASPEAIARGNAALDNVDLSKTLAGGAQRMNQRNLKVPSYIMQRARQVQAQRQQDRAARRLAGQTGQSAPAAPEGGDSPAADSDTSSEPER
jgi:hypothetical protein